ncbi:DNA repair protein RecO [bioreactor metagenome]|uniref:DNA repair protein RecO n=1 Tax=bioreactor metagenome TaxID=1076179 RepID=A0A644TA03_9ZZZZ|nr:DNA repair protein RecO [Negativicutes bacterium]
MTQYQTEAILLSVRNWGEADKMVTLFSREHGKIGAIAYGARRPKNRLAAGMQPFMHINISLTPGKGLDYIKQYETINTFRPIRENLDYMAYGALIAELTAELCPDHQPEPLIFDLLEGILRLLSERNPRVVVLAGAWQLLALSGFSPQYTYCTSCSKDLILPAYFSAAIGGGLCPSCRTTESFAFSAAAGDFLDKLLQLDWQAPTAFKVSGAALVEIEKLLICYLKYHIDKPLKSLDFIRQVVSS